MTRPSPVLYVGLGLFIALLPIQWLAVGRVAGLAIKPFHLALALVVLGLLLSRSALHALAAVVARCSAFIFAFALYLSAMVVALLWTSHLGQGFSILVKGAAYFAAFLVLAASIALLPVDGLRRTTRTAVPAGLATFFLTALVVFALIGQNLVAIYVNALARGSVDELLYGIYPVLFRFGATVSEGENVEQAGTALRNTLVGAFIVHALLLWLFRGRSLPRDRIREAALTGALALAILGVLLSISRSNILALALCVLGAWTLRVVRAGFRPHVTRVFMVLLGVCLLFGVMTAAGMWEGVFRVASTRFGNLAENPRIEMFEDAVLLIDAHPLRGAGLGSEVHLSSGKDLRVHHRVLSAWLEMGLFGLVTSLAYYLALIVAWGTFVVRIVRESDFWKLDVAPEWVAVLPVLPMFRVQLSGSGSFTLVEWFCLAVFFGLWVRNTWAGERSEPPLVTT